MPSAWEGSCLMDGLDDYSSWLVIVHNHHHLSLHSLLTFLQTIIYSLICSCRCTMRGMKRLCLWLIGCWTVSTGVKLALLLGILSSTGTGLVVYWPKWCRYAVQMITAIRKGRRCTCTLGLQSHFQIWRLETQQKSWTWNWMKQQHQTKAIHNNKGDIFEEGLNSKNVDNGKFNLIQWSIAFGLEQKNNTKEGTEFTRHWMA